LQASPLEALQDFAASTTGPLSATSYSRYRLTNRRLPTRNTITAAFGSWHAALTAAGLEDRAARDPRIYETREARALAGRKAQAELMRAEVLGAVHRFAATAPNLTLIDFIAWAREHAPECPSQPTIYRLFPGGWRQVLEAAGLGVRA
jgi:hypothetical protein